MDTLHTMPTDRNLPQHPHTPPYTPNKTRGKRTRIERSDSPASIQPAETESPAKKAAKRAAMVNDFSEDLQIQELTERDLGYMTDIEVIYPDELEEIGSTSSEHGADDERSSDDDDDDVFDDADGIPIGLARRLSKLHCDDPHAEERFEQGRRQRRLSKRLASRMVFKRRHSQSISNVEAGDAVTDVEAMDDHDRAGSRRRLRRRTRGPRDDGGSDVDGDSGSTPSSGSRTAAPPMTARWGANGMRYEEAMELDSGR